jgi:acetoacetyl-CoA synthetase
LDKPLWTPSPDRVAASQLTAFAERVGERHGVNARDYASLHGWSVEQPAAFWSAVWDYAGVVAETRGERALVDPQRMPGARFFPDARLNFAENLLRRRDGADAIVFWGESRVRRRLSNRELYDTVARLAQALKAEGVGPGDRVAGFLPNMPEAVIGMLAAASLGATWSSCSPDFGVQGVLDRFGQIEPRVLLAADGYFYNGRAFDVLPKVAEFAAQLPSLRRVVIVPYVAEQAPAGRVPGGVALADFLAPFAPGDISFAQLPFDHPLYVLYSSGTTGVPKCIVHGAGGTLLQHLKEHRLHADVQAGDRLFYFTTCGWMMWNWLASGLASGATLMLYDGSPFHPKGNVLYDFIDAEGITHFGTSAKFIDHCHKLDLKPRETHRLDSLRTILSTGSPLVPEAFDYVYREVKADLQLASISGGTDIVSCFVLGSPWLPVWRGEIQCKGLGMRVEVFDDDGRAIEGEKGELVCTAPFPSMPVGFWNDPDGAKYRAAYFERFPGVWCHGDYVAVTGHGGIVIYGRSDAVLNPGGVRIGTAEIYRQVEKLPEVLESLVIGQDWPPEQPSDVRVVLFVRLADGVALDAALEQKIKATIRDNTTPRHVPARIAQVTDIPRTKSGKIVELAVRQVVHGREVKNLEALANPEALQQFRDRPELSA